MTGYTPTTEQVRDLWENSLSHGCADREAKADADWEAERMVEQFDRWLERVRAEAQVEALREVADTLAGAEPRHLGGADEGLEFFAYGTAAEYGIDVAAAYLRIVANETAREAGIETGKKSDD